MWAGSKREAGSQRKEQDETTTQNAPVYIQNVSLLFPANGTPTNKPITFWGANSLLKKLDIKLVPRLAVSDTGTLNSDPLSSDKYLTRPQLYV